MTAAGARETRRGSRRAHVFTQADDITRTWHVIDADGLVLGRLATEVAPRLRGKHKPIFAPHVDTGDHVIVVNAAKVVLTVGQGGAEVRLPPQRLPRRAHARAATPTCSRRGPRRSSGVPCGACCPSTRLGRQQLHKLKVYAGPEHPHEAQQPEPLELPGARARG